MSMRVWLCRSVRLWEPTNTAVQENDRHLECMNPTCCEHLAPSSATSVSRNLLVPSQTAVRDKSVSSFTPVCRPASPLRATESLCGGNAHRSSSPLSPFLAGLCSKQTGRYCISRNQWLWSCGSGQHIHTHTTYNYTYNYTYSMYTCIVFKSCLISLCKYKCITFQILHHKCDSYFK